MNQLNQFVEESMQPFLKSQGFKKKGLLWNRERGIFTDVVTLQEAKHSTPENAVFTINLGVFVNPLFEIVWSKALNGFATEADCAVRLRLGDLIQNKPYGDAHDQWWTLPDDSESVALISQEIQKALEEMAIPFLEKFQDCEAIAEHLRQVKGWQAKNALFLIYRALAEWKSGSATSALKSLDAVQGKAWESKVATAREMVLAST
jgi:hypothetical protein